MTRQIDPTARIGSGVHLGPFILIGPNVEIGDGTRIEGFASIGTPPEHRNHYWSTGHGVRIGADVVIREFVTINAGTTRATVVDRETAVLKGAYVGHDAEVKAQATLSSGVMLGGHAWIGEGANLGLGTAVHQYRAVGAWAMVGMNATITRDLPPFVKAVGTPARPIGLNERGAAIAGFDLTAIEAWWNAGQPDESLEEVSGPIRAHVEEWRSSRP